MYSKLLSCICLILFMVLAMACDRSPKTNASENSVSKSATAQSAPAQPQSSEAEPVFGEKPTGTAPYAAPEPTDAEGMNPPHGQPNHRCDIAVGVPLDSPPGTGKTLPAASGQNMPLPTTITPTPTVASPTDPGMNPPHGQPNHRCDIAVGTPLDSPPGTGKQQTPNTTGASPSTSSPPIKIVPAPN